MTSYRKELNNLIREQAIRAEKMAQAIQLANISPRPKAWLAFIDSLLLWVSCIALGLSCIFFIAHNWSGLSKFAKFGLVELSLISSVITYLNLKANTIASKAVLLVSTLLLGALLALFGQTYQTGADPWQLFFNWALLITPWVIIAQFAPLLVIWLALINLAFMLYLEVNPAPISLMLSHDANALCLLFLFNSVSFIGWQWLSKSRIWMQQRWVTCLLALASGSAVTALALSAIFDQVILQSLAIPMWTVFLGAMYWHYRRVTIDLFMLSLVCLSAMIVGTSWCASYISGLGDEGLFLILAIIVISLGVACAMWLKNIQKELTAHA